jgi:hypothetical protein
MEDLSEILKEDWRKESKEELELALKRYSEWMDSTYDPYESTEFEFDTLISLMIEEFGYTKKEIREICG